MSHDNHHAATGYTEGQLLVDGCGECEYRSRRRDHGLDNLDRDDFERAWRRAAEWNSATPVNVSVAEAPMLSVLWSIQVQLERRGVPIGHIPSGELIMASTKPARGGCAIHGANPCAACAYDRRGAPVGCADHMVIDCPDCRCPTCQMPGHTASAHTDFS